MDPSPGPGSVDRRRHPRYDLVAQVHVKRVAEDYVLELRNVSCSGALVLLGSLRKPAWIDIDRKVELAIVNPETLDSVNLTGTVMRIQRDEHGLSFAVDFGQQPPHIQAAIDRLVQLGRPQPPPLPVTTSARQPPPLPR